MWDWWTYLSTVENNFNFSRLTEKQWTGRRDKADKVLTPHKKRSVSFNLNLSIMSLVSSILSWAELTGELYCLHTASNLPSQWGVGPSTANLSLDAISSSVNKAGDYCSMLNMWGERRDSPGSVSTRYMKDLSGGCNGLSRILLLHVLFVRDLIFNLNVCPTLRAIYYSERAPLRLNSCVHSWDHSRHRNVYAQFCRQFETMVVRV